MSKKDKTLKSIKEPINSITNKYTRNEEKQKEYMELNKNNLSTISSKKA